MLKYLCIFLALTVVLADGSRNMDDYVPRPDNFEEIKTTYNDARWDYVNPTVAYEQYYSSYWMFLHNAFMEWANWSEAYHPENIHIGTRCRDGYDFCFAEADFWNEIYFLEALFWQFDDKKYLEAEYVYIMKGILEYIEENPEQYLENMDDEEYEELIDKVGELIEWHFYEYEVLGELEVDVQAELNAYWDFWPESVAYKLLALEEETVFNSILEEKWERDWDEWLYFKTERWVPYRINWNEHAVAYVENYTGVPNMDIDTFSEEEMEELTAYYGYLKELQDDYKKSHDLDKNKDYMKKLIKRDEHNPRTGNPALPFLPF